MVSAGAKKGVMSAVQRLGVVQSEHGATTEEMRKSRGRDEEEAWCAWCDDGRDEEETKKRVCLTLFRTYTPDSAAPCHPRSPSPHPSPYPSPHP